MIDICDPLFDEEHPSERPMLPRIDGVDGRPMTSKFIDRESVKWRTRTAAAIDTVPRVAKQKRLPDEDFRHRRRMGFAAILLFSLSILLSLGLSLAWLTGAQGADNVAQQASQPALVGEIATPAATAATTDYVDASAALPDAPWYAITALVVAVVSAVAGVMSAFAALPRR